MVTILIIIEFVIEWAHAIFIGLVMCTGPLIALLDYLWGED